MIPDPQCRAAIAAKAATPPPSAAWARVAGLIVADKRRCSCLPPDIAIVAKQTPARPPSQHQAAQRPNPPSQAAQSAVYAALKKLPGPEPSSCTWGSAAIAFVLRSLSA
jgi:hypothetical protein